MAMTYQERKKKKQEEMKRLLDSLSTGTVTLPPERVADLKRRYRGHGRYLSDEELRKEEERGGKISHHKPKPRGYSMFNDSVVRKLG